MKKLLSMMLVLVLLLTAAVPAYADVMDARNSVVRVYAELRKNATGEIAYSTGCGFAVGEQGKPVEYFVTSTQVIIPDGYQLININIVLENEMSMCPASIKALSIGDLSVLEIAEPISERQAMILRPFDQKEAAEELFGEGVLAIDLPVFSTEDLGAILPSAVYDQFINSGIVTRVIENDGGGNGEKIQHTAVFGDGSIGSPLVDEEGNLLGINFAVIDGYGCAISSNEILQLLEAVGIPVEVAQKDGQSQGNN